MAKTAKKLAAKKLAKTLKKLAAKKLAKTAEAVKKNSVQGAGL